MNNVVGFSKVDKVGSPKETGKAPTGLQDIGAAMKDAAKTCSPRAKSLSGGGVDFCGSLMPSTNEDKKRMEEAKRKELANKNKSILCLSSSSETNDTGLVSRESNLLYRNGEPVPSSLVEDDNDQESLTFQMPPNLNPSSSQKTSKKTLFVSTLDSPTYRPANSPASQQSGMDMSTTESFCYDGAPPPMTIQHSTSEETDDDDLYLENVSSPSTKQTAVVDLLSPRVGKSIKWRNVNMTVAGKGDVPDYKLLKDVYGEVPENKATAIVGAAGAGKATLLNILAGRTQSGGRITVEAEVRLNNVKVDVSNQKVRKSFAFVPEEDSLQATETPREAFKFSAKLRLPRSTTDIEIDKLASRMINELGLTSCAKTLVNYLSKGEKKRTSIGVELIAKPTCLFLETPTAGLDGFEAMQVCAVLKKAAKAGTSVLFSMDQPNSEIFSSSCFDHLILLHKGHLMFQGPVDSVPDFFAANGAACPLHYNPADWIVKVAQKHPIEILRHMGFFPLEESNEYDRLQVEKDEDDKDGQDDEDDKDEEVNEVAQQTSKGRPGLITRVRMLVFRECVLDEDDNDGQDEDEDEEVNEVAHQRKDTASKGRPGLITQVRMLVLRECVSVYRFPSPVIARLGLTVFLSFLIGMMFFKVGEENSAEDFILQSQFGGLLMLLVFAMIGSAQYTILSFPKERSIFLRESKDHYSLLAYFISRLFIEATTTGIQTTIMVTLIFFSIGFRGSYWMYLATTYALAMSSTALAVLLGVLSEGNRELGQQLVAVMFFPQLFFSGFFVTLDVIPTFLRWAQWLCVFTYASRLLIVEEFYDCSDDPIEQAQCDSLLESVNAGPGDFLRDWVMIGVHFAVFRITALCLLKISAKFY